MVSVPELDEYVIASVRKIMPYGAFLSLDEYSEAEAFLHISEVSSGWIRNIREHIKENQKIVGKVIRVDDQKGQIDLSLKRVTDADRKRKLQAFTQEQRAYKMLEHCAKKAKATVEQASKEAAVPLVAEFGDLYSAFEAISLGQQVKSQIPKMWLTVITEVATQEIKPKVASERYLLTIQSYEGSGITSIRETLGKIPTLALDGIKVELHYLGAPKYYIDASGRDYKTLEKFFSKLDAFLKDRTKGELSEYSLEKAPR